MTVYIISLLASVVITLALTAGHNTPARRRIALLIAAIPMILVASIRYNVGEDFAGYLQYFRLLQLQILPNVLRMEPIFHGLNQIIIWLHGDATLVFTICAILFYTLVHLQIAEESPMPALSVYLLTVMGFTFVFFNAMRQMVGCAILLFSLRYVKRRKLFRFLICIALATGFHRTCLLFAVVYLLYHIRISPKAALVTTGALVALTPLVVALVRLLVSYTPYYVYFSSVFDTGKTAYVMLAINAVLLLFLSWQYAADDRSYCLYYDLQLLALWITFFSGQIVLSLRLLWMFGLPSIISLPIAIKRVKDEKVRALLTIVVAVMYFAYMIYTVWYQNSNSVLPYQTILTR